MYIKKELLISAFAEFEEIVAGYALPSWNMLPDIELYMDQVVSVVKKYLDVQSHTIEFNHSVTPSMINNYVKLGIIPSPTKKRYSRIHLAYLLIVFTLKQTLDMNTIQRIIPVGLPEDEVRKTYDSFVKNQHKAFNYVFTQTREVAEPIISLDGNNQDRMNDLLMQVSVSANLFKLLTEKITHLDDEK